ncbi:MAG TPA: hypothetical protein VHC98_01605 [Candidatus Saccharimonadales bacterium]|nr:hypothetical protein [Candidatus Saccharimonadales bacterium]
MPSLPFREIKRLIADGAAPGSAVSLFADGATQSCAGGHYTGSPIS